MEATKLFPRLHDSKHVSLKKKKKRGKKAVDQIWAGLFDDLTEISVFALFPCCGRGERFCQIKYLM